jgi:hypothetical protein
MPKIPAASAAGIFLAFFIIYTFFETEIDIHTVCMTEKSGNCFTQKANFPTKYPGRAGRDCNPGKFAV